MPNIRSAKKRMRQNIKRREHNRKIRTTLRSLIKRAEKAIAGDDKEAALKALQEVTVCLDRTAGKGVIHANKAARKKSRLTRHFNANFA